jgi:hypothetical protein
VFRANAAFLAVPNYETSTDCRILATSITACHIETSQFVVAVSPSNDPENPGGVTHAAHGTTHVDAVFIHTPDVHVHVHPLGTHPAVVVDSVVVEEAVVVDPVVVLAVVVDAVVVLPVVLAVVVDPVVVLVVVGVSVSGSSVFPQTRRPHHTEPPENGMASENR